MYTCLHPSLYPRTIIELSLFVQVPSQLLNNKKVVISTLEEVRIRYGERNQ
jgi:hypothetical protein